jgi:glycerol uptake facilitator-like aquaporin
VNAHPARRAAAEFLGTALLVALAVGSGIMAQRLSPTDIGLQLLENSTASTHRRSAGHLWLGEVVATAGLVLLIFALGRTGRGHYAPPAVGA